MSIIKRGAIYYARFTAPDGQRVFKSCKTANKEQAQEYHDKLKSDAWRIQRMGDRHVYSWDQAAEKYIEEKEDLKSIDDVIWHLELLHKHFSGYTLNQININLIDKFKKSRSKDRNRQGKRISGSTINRSLQVLRAVLRYARDVLEWINKIPQIRLYKESEKRVRWINAAEIGLLIKECPEHLKPMVVFALQTGLRESNITGLQWSQVDLTRKTAWVNASESKNSKAIGIPLNQAAINAIKAQMGKHYRYVFTYKGKPIQNASTKAFRKAVKRAGIEDFHWHDLRHTWASHHVMNGTPLNVLMELGGWSSLEMVLRYAHLSTDHLQKYSNNAATKFAPSTQNDNVVTI